MKQVTLLFFIILTPAYNLLSQDLKFSDEFIKSAIYSNIAELSICNNNLEKAAIYYDSVFQLKVNPRSRDIYNREICARKLGDLILADSMLKKLYLEGYTRYFPEAYNDTTISFQFKNDNDSKKEKYYDIIQDIIETDQSANAQRYSYMKKYLNVVQLNAKRIMNLVKMAEADSLDSFNLENSGLYIQILHFFQLWNYSNRVNTDTLFLKKMPLFSCMKDVDFKSYKFDEFLIKQTRKRKFDPYTLAHLYSILGIKLGFNVVTQYNNYVAINAPDLINENLLNKINDNRNKFGLESYEDYFIKVRYADSLLNNGKPFIARKQGGKSEPIVKKNNSRKFKLVGQYHMWLNFVKPEIAKKSHEMHLLRLSGENKKNGI